jgi:hypothetical protein
MKDMPKCSPFRPHFMAPGPHVEILKDKPISFEEAKSRNNDNLDDDDDEDFTPYKYYPSSKILGKLYSAIDEREIFGRVQQNRLEQSLQQRRASNTARSVLESVWDYVNSRFPLIILDDHLDRARGIRDE